MRTSTIQVAAKCALLLAVVSSAAWLSGCVPAARPTSGSQLQSRPTSLSEPATAASVPATQPATPTPPPREPKVAKSVSASSVTVPSDNTLLEWNFRRNKTHAVPEIAWSVRQLTKRYRAMYVGPDPKLVYLTFDEGYENGNTPKILDTLRRNGVHATFFVTGAYCREAPKLCRRMLAEGHVVGSHSNTHPSMPSLTSSPASFTAQFTKTDAAFKKATGQPIAHLFRPPMGNYSAKSLAMTHNLGYTSVFWTFAHVDYDEKHQPPVPATIALVLSGSHPGAIFLLHAMSASNTAALEQIIWGLRERGYEFGTLTPR